MTTLVCCLLELKNGMQKMSETLHPRPQLTRARWIDLDGPWGFAYDDDACGLDKKWQEKEEVFTRTIQVPYPPESSASGIGDNGFHAIIWYRRTFEVSPEDAEKRLLLHCGVDWPPPPAAGLRPHPRRQRQAA